MVEKLDRVIKEEEVLVGEMGRMGGNSRILVGKMVELEEQVGLFGGFCGELGERKKECVGMRPQLIKSRVEKFEAALGELACF